MSPYSQYQDQSLGALVLFCRRPELGVGKTRLAASLGIAKTFEIAEALLECAIEDLCQWPGPKVLSPASAKDENYFKNLRLNEVQILTQPEGNLGQKLNRVEMQLRQKGYSSVLFMGSDSPVLSLEQIRETGDLLNKAEVVLKPARDGGVVVMGSNQPWPDLQNLPWSESNLGHELKNLCESHGLKVMQTPESYDIDSKADLQCLQQDLLRDKRESRKALLKKILSLNLNSYGSDS
jgi:rSAM/selenodomain-associated transferase 1